MSIGAAFKAIAIGLSLGVSRSTEKFVIPAHQQCGPQSRPQSTHITCAGGRSAPNEQRFFSYLKVNEADT